MRLILVLLATTSVAACGGSGPTTVGSSAVSGSSTGATAGITPTSPHTFVVPTDPKTYTTIGGAHSYSYSTDTRNFKEQYGKLYQGDASTARNGQTTIAYNPRDAIFELIQNHPLAGVTGTARFQDPAHRTDFGGAREPQTGVPDIQGKSIFYLEAGGASGTYGANGFAWDALTLFYQKPGTKTNYVSYAGYVRNTLAITDVSDPNQPLYKRYDYTLQRSTYAYGERTANAGVPATGSGTFTGDMLATMVFNDQLDTVANTPTYFQWITGSATTKVNFAAGTFTFDVAGIANAPQFVSATGGSIPIDEFTNRRYTIQNGAAFTATGAGRVDLVNAGGFLGSINSAYFVQPNATRLDVTLIGGPVTPNGGSSVDGAFFGPAAQEVGGGFRIVGGVPDERVDILGAFTGKRP
jgi:hypothetical protein